MSKMKKNYFVDATPAIEAVLGYEFRDPSLLMQAFTRTSYCNEERGAVRPQSNEVLEFLGDSVLSLSVATMLTEENSVRYEYGIKTEWREGDFSNIKSRLSDKTNLSESIKKLGFQKYLLMGEGDVKLGIESEPSVMEDLFESIIGAVYIDSGKSLPTVMGVISNMLDVSVYMATESRGREGSYKNLLQEWCAEKTRRLPPPRYEISSEGPDHERTYRAICYIGTEAVSVGTGKNKKSAEAMAAKIALDGLKANYAPKTEKKEKSPTDIAAQYAKTHGKSSPEYRDLGESNDSTPSRPVFVFECSFAGFCAIAEAPSKKEAKLAALSEILKQLKKKH